MKRRSFLQMFGLAPAAIVVAPAVAEAARLPEVLPEPPPEPVLTSSDFGDRFLELLRKPVDAPTGAVYLGLHTEHPLRTMTPFEGPNAAGYTREQHPHEARHEATYGGYERARVERTPEGWDLVEMADCMEMRNVEWIVWPTCTGGSECMKYCVVYDHPTGGRPLCVVQLNNATLVHVGIAPQCGPGDLTIGEQELTGGFPADLALVGEL